MKKFREKMSERAGFTLVELIVVIAILGILAGAAVAGYSGYIKKAQAASDTQILSAVKTAAEASVARYGTVNEIAVTLDSGAIKEVKIKTSNTTLIADDTDLKGSAYAEGASDAAKAAVAAAREDFKTFFTDVNPNAKLTSEKFANGATWTLADGWKATDNT